jgi:hypothetical protein
MLFQGDLSSVGPTPQQLRSAGTEKPPEVEPTFENPTLPRTLYSGREIVNGEESSAWEMRWRAQAVHRTTADEPEQTGCHEGPPIHFDRPRAGTPAPRLIRFPVGLGRRASARHSRADPLQMVG